MRKKWLGILVISVIMLGLCGVMVTTLVLTAKRLPAISKSWGINLDLANISASAEEDKTFSVDGPAELVVNGDFGNIDIQGGPGSQIVIKAQKTAYGYNQDDANNQLKDIQVSMVQQGNKVSVSMQDLKSSGITVISKPKVVEYTIQVPEKTSVTATSQVSNINLSGTSGKAELFSSFGKLSVSHLEGELNARTNNGNVLAELIQSGEAPILIQTDFGEIKANGLSAGEINIKSNNGNIGLVDMKAADDVTVSSRFGQVSIENGSAKALEIDSQNGNISLDSLTVQGAVTAQSDFGRVALTQVNAASYDVSSKNGNLTLDGVSGKVKTSSDFGSITVSQAKDVTLDISGKNGKIEFEGSLGQGPHSIRTDFGSVTLKLPPDSGLTVQCKTGFGTIKSEFELSGSSAMNDKNVSGKIGAGGPLLTVESNNGNISLQKNQP